MHYVTFSTVLCILGFQSPFILIQFGWLISWIYLRFYKRTSSEVPGGVETYGDRSEAFAFVHWFPSFLQWVTPILSFFVKIVQLPCRNTLWPFVQNGTSCRCCQAIPWFHKWSWNGRRIWPGQRQSGGGTTAVSTWMRILLTCWNNIQSPGFESIGSASCS